MVKMLRANLSLGVTARLQSHHTCLRCGLSLLQKCKCKTAYVRLIKWGQSHNFITPVFFHNDGKDVLSANQQPANMAFDYEVQGYIQVKANVKHEMHINIISESISS